MLGWWAGVSGWVGGDKQWIDGMEWRDEMRSSRMCRWVSECVAISWVLYGWAAGKEKPGVGSCPRFSLS